MTTVVEIDPTVAERLGQAVPGTPLVVPATGKLARHLKRHAAERAVVLGPSVPVADALRFAEENRIARPTVGVVLVRKAVDQAVLASAMRAGVREVVATHDLPGLASAVRRIEAVARAMSGAVDHAGGRADAAGVRGGLVTVFSTKGGVGKTFVATNLAVALADLGHRTCVVDLDVDGGDVAMLLSLAPQHTVEDLARFGAELDRSVVESLLTRHSARLSMLAAPVQLGADVPAESIGAVLDLLKRMFDVVIVDTAPAFGDPTLQALDHSDLLVLVGTLDVPALKNLKLTVATLDLLNHPPDLRRLTINRVDSRIGLTVEEFEHTLGVRAAATIPSSREVLLTVNRGDPIARSHAGHAVSRALRSLAAMVSRDLSLTLPVEPVRARASRRGGRGRKAA